MVHSGRGKVRKFCKPKMDEIMKAGVIQVWDKKDRIRNMLRKGRISRKKSVRKEFGRKKPKG